MATAILKYDGRNQAMKQLLELFKTLGGTISIPEKKTSKSELDFAIDEIKQGNVTKCKDFNDYLTKINA